MESHKRITREILPRFADRLKEEGLISNYERERKSLQIPILDDASMPALRVFPDMIIFLRKERKVLVEVVNANQEPKRFLGELIYPHVLGNRKKIAAAIIFVLGKGEKTFRRLDQNILLYQFIKSQQPTIVWGWPKSEHEAYHLLKDILTKRLFSKKEK